MKMFRCTQCNREFESDTPACVECGIDAAQDPRDGDVILELKLHHFDPPSKRPGRGLGHAACDSRIRVGVPNCSFTGEPAAVNCPRCKQTEAFKGTGGLSNGAIPMKAKAIDKKGG